MQSILTFFPLMIIIWILSALFIGVSMMGGFGIWSVIITLIEIVMLLLWLFLMYKAYKGEKFLVPIVGPIAESQVK